VETWFKGLSREKILDLLAEELAKRLALCGDYFGSAKTQAYIKGINRAEAEEIFKKVKINCAINDDPSVSGYPSITLETGDIRVIAGIGKTVEFLLQEKRAELVEALVDPSFIEEEA